ncbi:hypothetical protein ONS96_006338 [Cadophora gregata f. sp. sojae]|nr:hypothetical protein ONS96_006338 [Cadophora gregata f. sp. sojae]
MAEPPYKRARRPDSKQMWDEADRRAPQAPLPSRERDERERPDRGNDRREDRNRDRRYRSRSPRDSRGAGGGGGRDRERGGRRDERERDTRDGYGRGGRDRDGEGERGGRRDYRERDRGMYPTEAVALCHRGKSNAFSKDGGSARDRDGGRERDMRDRDYKERDGGRESRDRPRERSRDRARDTKRGTRSRSPRRERDRDSRREAEAEKEIPKPYHAEEEFTKARTATPPVSFKVNSAGNGQDHERMEVDAEAQPGKKGKKGKKAAKPIEEDDDLIVEDDGMAAMQAMMGFGGFGTTHQQKVAGNDIYAVRKEKKTEYRQYMNRVGGFNRPLSPSRE